MSTPMPQTTTDVIPHTITMATAISPSASIAIQRSPSKITMATSPFEMTTCNSIGGNPEIGVPLPTKTNVISTHSFVTTNTAVNTNSTIVPDLVMTSPTVPILSSELISTSKSGTAQKHLDFQAVEQPLERMTSPNVTEAITSSELTVTSSLAISRTPQHFSLSYDPTTSSTILMTSPDENGVPQNYLISELPKASQSGENNDRSAQTTVTTDTQDFTCTSRSSNNSQPNQDSLVEMQAT